MKLSVAYINRQRSSGKWLVYGHRRSLFSYYDQWDAIVYRNQVNGWQYLTRASEQCDRAMADKARQMEF